MEQKARITRNEQTAKRHRLVIYALVLLVAVCGVSGGLLAKYVTQNRQQAEMISAGFHISSDYLKEGGPSYTVSTTGALIVHLYNYEVENTAQRSQVPMTYTVSVDGGTCAVSMDGDALTPAGGSYTFGKYDQDKTHTLTITPNASTVTVTVETTSPYGKTLSATFDRSVSAIPEYTFMNQNNGTGLLTIKTNAYAGTISVNWVTAKYSPDNTNHLMENWRDSTGIGTFTAAANSTYELLFVGKTSTISAKNGTGTSITLN